MNAQSWPDIAEYAAQLGVSRYWVRDAVTARRIFHSRIGRSVRFSPEDQAKNQAMWAQEPARTPAAVLVRMPAARSGRRSA